MANFSKKTKPRKRVRCLDLIRDLIATQPGPSDASANPKHLEQAILADFKRSRKRPVSARWSRFCCLLQRSGGLLSI